MPKDLNKKDLEKFLLDFISELEDRGLMYNSHFNYSKIIKRFVKAFISRPSEEYLKKHLD
jgi:hypothetical protein